jgi:hypothetical protein
LKLSQMTRAELLAILNDPEAKERKRVRIALRLLRGELDRERMLESAKAAGLDWPPE